VRPNKYKILKYGYDHSVIELRITGITSILIMSGLCRRRLAVSAAVSCLINFIVIFFIIIINGGWI